MLNEETIIIDNGTSTIKAGYSDDDMPRVVIPTVLGRPTTFNQIEEEEEDKKNDKEKNEDENQLDIFVGDEALNKGGTLSLVRPIEKGIIKDYACIELIWKHIFYNELLAEPKRHPVIITESPYSEYQNREQIAEILFDHLGVEYLYITNSSTLALYANGKTTGTVVDIGYERTSFTPIYEGFTLNCAKSSLFIGGNDLTDFLCKLIKEHGPETNNSYFESSQKQMINDLKEEICEVAEDYDSQIKKCQDSNSSTPYQLPDGSTVYINLEKYKCPELLFQPSLNTWSNSENRNLCGIHEETLKVINKCDEGIQKDMFQNVILCGGSSLFLKTRKKFEKELQSLAPTGKTVKIIAPPERKFSPWLGGAILSSMDSFKKELFVSKEEWANGGHKVIYNKFF